MSALPNLVGKNAHPERVGLGAKLFSVFVLLYPLCLTYLTYIYIYYKGSSTAPRPAAPHKKIVTLVGHGWASTLTPRKAKIKSAFLCLDTLGSGQPHPLGGWAA